MKTEVLIKKNLILIEDEEFGGYDQYTIDCASFIEKHPDIFIVVEDGYDIWCEREPFKGRDDDFDKAEYQKLVDQALAQKQAKIDSQNTIEAIKERKLSYINMIYSDILAPMVTDYPEIETKTWGIQEEEARGYLKDPTHPTPLLSKVLEGRNGQDGTETISELCEAVIRNSDQFKQIQVYTGYRQRLEKKVKQATTKDEVEAITWEMT